MSPEFPRNFKRPEFQAHGKMDGQQLQAARAMFRREHHKMPRMRSFLLTLSGLICGFLLLVCPNSYAECQSTEDAVIKNDDGDVVYLVSKVCDGIAASEEGSIDLALQGGKRTTIFKYDSAYSFVRNGAEATPNVTWENSKTLRISIGKVAAIDMKLEKYDGISIIYDIKSVVLK